jgi:hypothetical protein
MPTAAPGRRLWGPAQPLPAPGPKLAPSRALWAPPAPVAPSPSLGNLGGVTAAQVTTALIPYAPLASPVFTGAPNLPTGSIGVTQAAANNSTALATTAFVKAQNYLIGNQTITLSGDITGSGTTAINGTLATVNSNIGQFESLTINGKGLVTAGAVLSGYGTTAAGVLTVNRVRGVTNGSNAAAGDVGEYFSANVPLSPGGAISSGVVTNMISLSLTAGDWDVGGNVVWSPAAATIIANAQAAVSTTSAALPDNSNRLIATTVPMTANDSLGAPVPVLRVNVTVTTTVYLGVFVVYSAGTLTVCGNIWARRVR